MKLDEFAKEIDKLHDFSRKLRKLHSDFVIKVVRYRPDEITQKIIDEFEAVYGELEDVSNDLGLYWENLWSFYRPLKQAFAEKEDCQRCGEPLYYYEEEEQFRYDHTKCGEAA